MKTDPKMIRYNDLELARMLYEGTIKPSTVLDTTGYSKTRVCLLRRAYGLAPHEVIEILCEYTPHASKNTPHHETGRQNKKTGWVSFEHLYEVVNHGIDKPEDIKHWVFKAEDMKLSLTSLRKQLRASNAKAISGKWKRDRAGYIFFKHLAVCELMLKNGFNPELEGSLFVERYTRTSRMAAGMIFDMELDTMCQPENKIDSKAI